jgi:pyruvate dehydrogenase E2 component (dihydrolipoamide acetyltransferase)
MSRPSSVKGDTEVVEPSRGERAVGRRAAESRATVPFLEMGVEVEMTACIAAAHAEEVSIDACLIRACALALAEVPRANGSYRDGHFEMHSRVNVAVVIEAEDTSLAATVVDADRKSLLDLADELVAIERRARDGELTSPEMSGATFTFSNPGRYGVAAAAPIVQPPQAAAIAAGAIREVPVVRDTAIVPGHLMTLTLACDHRILFGAAAARFLCAVQGLLERGAL